MQFVLDDGTQTIDHEDAQILQDYDDVRHLNYRTRKAIHDTYGPKQATKLRRKLPGKRKWKNKENRYKDFEGQMTINEWNAKQKAMKVLDKHYKKQARSRQRHSLND